MEPADETANLLAKHFISRRDVKAVQHRNGSYEPERSHFTRGDLRDHLSGTHTYGHYVLGSDNTVKFFCFDIDVDKTGLWVDGLGNTIRIDPRAVLLDDAHPAHRWLVHQLRCMADGLSDFIERKLGTPSAILWSGAKGIHVYGMTGPTSASEARAAARWVLDDLACFQQVRGEHFFKHLFVDDPMHGYPHLTLEVFPKQDTLDGKDLGNLLRLPLGVNRRSGKPSFFMDPKAEPGTIRSLDPALALSGATWKS